MCFTRKFRSPDAHPPPDVRAAHAAAAQGDDGLRRFLDDVQRERPSDADRILAVLSGGGAAGGIARFVGRSPAHAVPSLDDFFGFLFSPDLNPPIDSKVRCSTSLCFIHCYGLLDVKLIAPRSSWIELLPIPLGFDDLHRLCLAVQC
jgi:phosphatidylinositol phospholipase C delta